MRLAHALLAAVAMLLPVAAGASDVSQFAPIGFSEDGKIFAFEEFGVQDGSGFPYSSIFVIDLVRDAFVDGSRCGRLAMTSRRRWHARAAMRAAWPRR